MQRYDFSLNYASFLQKILHFGAHNVPHCGSYANVSRAGACACTYVYVCVYEHEEAPPVGLGRHVFGCAQDPLGLH